MNNTEIRRPVIGITMGDPAGNGPELCVQALLHKAIYEECRPLIVGDANVIEKAAVLLGHPELTVHRVDSVEQAAFTWGIIDVYHLDLVDLARFEYGKVSAMCGRAASISASVTMQLSGRGASFSKSGLLQAMRGAGTPSGLE